MPTVAYDFLDTAGRRLSGTMEGDTSGAGLTALDRAGYLPIRAVETRGGRDRSWQQVLTPEPKDTEIAALTLDIVMLLQTSRSHRRDRAGHYPQAQPQAGHGRVAA